MYTKKPDPKPFECDAGEGQLIRGTGGGHDYLVFGRNGDVVIGIKPMFAMDQATTAFAFRIRAVRLPLVEPAQDVEGVDNVIGFKAKAPEGMDAVNEIVEAFPGFKFQKRDPSRCSLVCQIPPVPAGYYQIEDLEKWVVEKDLIGVIMAFLNEHLGDIPLQGRAVLRTFLTDWVTNSIEHVKSKVAPPPEKKDLGELAPVIEFPGLHAGDADLDGETEDEEDDDINF